jgi:hypothetical protein
MAGGFEPTFPPFDESKPLDLAAVARRAEAGIVALEQLDWVSMPRERRGAVEKRMGVYRGG